MSKCGWLALVAGALVLSQVCAGDKPVRKKGRSTPPAPAVTQQVTPVEVVEGSGKTRQQALDQAALRAQAKVEELLKGHLGEDRWQRRPHQLEPDYLQEMKVISLDAALLDAPAANGLVVARYNVSLTRPYLDAVTARHV